NVLFIEASHGLSHEEAVRGKYALGEGITGKVAAAGLPKVIADISAEPQFLNRTGSRSDWRDTAFLCVPIIHRGDVIGTMSVDRRTTPEADLDRDLRLLETVANLLAEAVAACSAEHEARQKLIEENSRLKRELGRTAHPPEIIGNCQSMKSVYEMISQVADSRATVLIRGSSGTGKELVARAIQRTSGRKNGPFVVVNAAALPENLIESELFGHEKGAFTGAVARRIGRVEAADGGTLFLDEIGDLGVGMQVKLLRFLQERTYQRIGGNTELTSDVRVVAATSRDLESLIAQGKFREDLYYRLNVFPIHLPDLVNRKSDITLLADHFLNKYNKQHHRSIRRISSGAINLMMNYRWPGNIRELENCIERAVLTARDNVIHAANLPPTLQTARSMGENDTGEDFARSDFHLLVDSYERELIVDALKIQNGNTAGAARRLGLTARVIRYKIVSLGIDPSEYKERNR
ncbi:MAG: sigma 54-interacting transcriptional regulator, partial [Victivallaceae bacterium]|nr:sigma 54-interacting transcriptional regulator [Victivallaceae bacterium]